MGYIMKRQWRRTLALIVAICLIATVMLTFAGCDNNDDSNKAPLITREYIIETFGVTEDDLEGLDIDTIAEFHDLRQNWVTPDNMLDIVSYLENCEKYMNETLSNPVYFWDYIFDGSRAREPFSAEDIKYFAILRNPGDTIYKVGINFETGTKYNYSSSEDLTRTVLNDEIVQYYRDVIDYCQIYKWRARYMGFDGCTTGSNAWFVGIELYDGTVYSYYGQGMFGNNAPSTQRTLFDCIK